MKRLTKFFQNNFFPLLILLLVIIFFYPVFLQGKLPIPADTITGMYYPFKDVSFAGYPSGVPYKNFLTTDPVRQQYVWRYAAMSQMAKGELPLWNPYSFSGTPLLANFQSAPFYPLNVLFIFLPFDVAWTILVIVQPLLAGIFLYFYLKEIGTGKMGAFIGSIAFAFSGFSIAWLEWNTVIQTALWLPLLLLSIERIIQTIGNFQNSKLQVRKRKIIIWVGIFTFSLIFSFFAGHLQVLFYEFLVTNFYLTIKIVLARKNKLKIILLFAFSYLLFVVLTSIQWLPLLRFIMLSARNVDQGNYTHVAGWFLPWQNLVQFIAPDFFGNPSTNNYWGIWNYGEFIGFIGILPLILALYALVFRYSKKALFFSTVFFLSLIFSLPNVFSMLPFSLHLPLLSSSQPTRLMFLVDFSLSILAAFGFDNLSSDKNIRKILWVLIPVAVVFILLWIFVLKFPLFNLNISAADISVSKRNLFLPSIVYLFSAILLLGIASMKMNNKIPLFFLLIIIFIAEIFRFGWKFTPFSKSEFLYPPTTITNFIKKDKNNFRMMTTDRRIMPPNFSVYYELQDVAGYDPLYLLSYNRFAASWGRGKTDIDAASFNRIVTPSNYDSFFSDLLGVKYIMSFGPLKSAKLKHIMTEGNTYLYENKKVFPRAFFVGNIVFASNPQEEMDKMYSLADNLRNTAVLNKNVKIKPQKKGLEDDKAEIVHYEANDVQIKVVTTAERLMVLTDIYYPSWKASIDGRPAEILKADFLLRAIVVPKGEHTIMFYTSLI
ncbi:MAG: YfhO family protein [Patescibacteria group bacterium]|nr:YfhO family protein [Patescibacteria group bacterium]